MNRLSSNPEFREFFNELAKLIPNTKDWPNDKEFSIRISEIIDSRRRTNVPKRELNAKTKALALASAIPKASIRELEKKAKKSDPQAILSLGDIFYFGLKGKSVDITKGIGYYDDAVLLNQPEAISMIIYNNYLTQLSFSGLKDGNPIPANIFSTNVVYQNHIKEMWELMEKLVDLNWITPLFYTLGDDARRTKSYPVPPKILRELIKLDVEDFRIKMEKDKKFKFICSNPNCNTKLETKLMMITSDSNENVKYCSQECYLECSKDKLANSLNKISISSTLKQEMEKNYRIKATKAEVEQKEINNHLINKYPLERFKSEGERLFNRRRYGYAIRYFNLAIEKILSDTFLCMATREELIELTEIFVKKVSCLLKLTESSQGFSHYLTALSDCEFVLEDSNYKRDLIRDTDALRQIEGYKLRIQRELAELREERATRPVRQRRVRQQQTNRSSNQINKNKQNSEILEYGQIQVDFCSSLVENKSAKNAQSDQDICPMCYTEWSRFVDFNLAAILPCNHACCLKCMSSFQKSNEQLNAKGEQEDQEELSTNTCSLCREEFSPSYLEDIANKIVQDGLIGNLLEHLEKLPLSEEEANKLVINLLLKNDFDLAKCENALYSMAGYVSLNEQDLSNEQKQEYFELARAPVKQLNEEYQRLKQELNSIFVSENEEWLKILEELKNVKEKLSAARRNAANDIFERINSTVRMGSQLDENSIVHVDFHGLYVKEAQEKVQDFVLPMLPVLKKIILITGYGLHSKNGESNLKEAMMKFLQSLKIKFEEHPKNKGAILIYWD